MKIRITTLSLLLILVIGMQMIGYNAIFTLCPIQSDREQVIPTTYAVQTPPTPLWTSSFGSSGGGDYGWYVVQCSDGGFAIAGWSDAYSAGGDDDATLIRVDANGNFVWGQVYGGTDDDCAYALVECSDGGFALVGYTGTTTEGSVNMWLVRTDSSGNEQWTQNYVHDGQTGSGSAIVQVSGGFALAGYTYVSTSMDTQAWLVRTDSSGNMLWDQTYGDVGNDYFREIVVSHTGGYGLAGYSRVAGNEYDFYLVTTTSSGVQASSNTYHNSGDDICNSLVRAGAYGGYALAGRTGAPDNDFWLVRTNVAGVKMWDQTYGDAGDDDAGYSLAECWDGGFVLAGDTDGWHTSYDFYIVRTDASGNMLWEQAYGSTANDFCNEIIVCSDGSYALVGYSWDTGNEQAWLMRIPSIINPGLPTNLLLIIGGVVITVVVVVIVVFFVLRRRRAPVDTGV